MKKTLLIITIAFFAISCQSESEFNKKGKFYKGIDGELELYLTFINDTIVAINSDSLKICRWNFMKFKNSSNGLFKTNELKTDTTWFKSKNKYVELYFENQKIEFKETEIPKSHIEKTKRELEFVRKFSDKGITFECDYSIKQIGYFYEEAIKEVKDNLKNPNTAKFNETYIHKYKMFNDENEYVKSKTTLVSLEIEAKNGFGNFTEDKYYVFFTPMEKDESKYDVKFSDSPILEYDITERYKEIIDELGELELEE
ncbi:hypothetical protein [uncultured Psychroserpens sp.]|uniref:hypothetical protein n=1 Tax=uncultured Psychroserpens sp. TaxID=255436 RepID=UPI002616B696|nr:hypothetical protein [uncultured Psychroserpens sp.]